MQTFNYSNTGSSATIKSGPGAIFSANLAAGSDAATAIIYDNTAASGTVIWKLSAPANGNAFAQLQVPFGDGCHVALTGTSPSFSISYR